MKLLVADDHALVREGLKHTLIGFDENIEIVEAEDGEQVKKILANNQPIDLALLDLYMPNTNGFELIDFICNNYPDILVVVLSASDDPDNMRKVLDRGASGFIPKTTIKDVILTALKLVMSGGVYIPPDMFKSRPKQETAPQSQPDLTLIKQKLTPRQLEVLNLIAQGYQNKHIAHELNLSEHTVKIHITAIFKALGVKNRTQAVLTAQNLLKT